MQLYSIAIKPCTGIGYAFAVMGENPKHALSVLSWDIRNAMKQGAVEHTFVETLRMIRKYWRYHSKKWSDDRVWTVSAVTIVPCTSICISYDMPIIPIKRWDDDKTARLEYTGSSRHPIANLSPRRKPAKRTQEPNVGG